MPNLSAVHPGWALMCLCLGMPVFITAMLGYMRLRYLCDSDVSDAKISRSADADAYTNICACRSADADAHANIKGWRSADANADANIHARRSADANADANIWNIDKYHELLISTICDSAVVTEYRLHNTNY